jgi:cobalt/nickel transport system permease protein
VCFRVRKAAKAHCRSDVVGTRRSLATTVQALVFGDESLAPGANIWNTAILRAYVGYAVYSALVDRDELLALVAHGWIEITAAAVPLGLQLGASFGITGEHLVPGISEGVPTQTRVVPLYHAGVESEPLHPEVVRV